MLFSGIVMANWDFRSLSMRCIFNWVCQEQGGEEQGGCPDLKGVCFDAFNVLKLVVIVSLNI